MHVRKCNENRRIAPGAARVADVADVEDVADVARLNYLSET
jgi:hypothetical protein